MDSEDVLAFWLGHLDDSGIAPAEIAARWYKKDETFDREVRVRFEVTWHRVRAGEYDTWLATPRGRLAYVIVLDQLSRNMFRNSARAFEGDEQALEAAERGIELGHDRALRGDERVFLYMPFQHAESLAVQERGVALYRAFRDETHGALREHLTENVSFAERHRDIIAQWGRFPHRNGVLGRESSADERDFLEQPGSSF
jgi:uncharacterized protein (DUF924 family)